MRPIILSGHTRAITQVKFSKEADFLFSVSKDHVICAWYSDNGERRGTYDGHKGAIWSVDSNPSTKLLASGSADNTMRLWDIHTGKLVKTWEYPTAVKRVEFSEDGKLLLCITEKRMGYMSNIYVYDVVDDPEATQTEEPTLRITVNDLPRVTMAGLSALNRYIITGHEDGSISQYDFKSGELIDNVQRHDDCINDLQWNADRTTFITASKDKTAKLHDWDSLRTLKTYLADAPVNTATITDANYVILGGGQAAMDVTTTSARQGKFEARFHSLVFEEEVARVRLHFGPLNSVNYKNGMFCSGGEDGYSKILHMDTSFHTFKFEVEREREAMI